jgi:hypothetical protein
MLGKGGDLQDDLLDWVVSGIGECLLNGGVCQTMACVVKL